MSDNILDIESKKYEVKKILELAEKLQDKCSFLGFNENFAIQNGKLIYKK